MGGIEEIFRIELAVAQKFEHTAMELVCAGLDRYIHDGAAGPAEFRAHGVRLHFELGDGVRRGSDDEAGLVGQVFRQAVVIDSVEQIIVLIRAHSVGAEAAGALVARAGGRWRSACRQHRQPRKEAPVQRQIDNFLAVDNLAKVGGIGLQAPAPHPPLPPSR